MAEEMKQPPKLEKVIEGTAKVDPEGTGLKSMKLFVADDIRAVGMSMLTDVLFPQAKMAIYNALANGLSALFWGAGGTKKSSGTLGLGTKVNYAGSSTALSKPSVTPQLPASAGRYATGRMDPDDVEFETRLDAQRVLDSMCDILLEYERVTFAQLLELAGIPNSNYTLQNLGWTNLRDAVVRRMGNGNWYISFPKMRPV